MTYEEALQIAMEELYDAVEVLRRNNKGYEATIEMECNRLLTARNALCKALEEAGESYDQTALELCERCGWKTLIPDEGCLNCKRREWVGLTKKEIDSISERVRPDRLMTEEPRWHIRFAQALQRKLKDLNT